MPGLLPHRGKSLPRYGIFGGTFDPIHLAHLLLAEMARESCGLDKVIFVPAANPPHKSGLVVAAARHRLRMVEIAVADNPCFEVSRVEIDRAGPSYTVDTVRWFRQSVPDAEWCLIVGSDTLAEIPGWHEYRSLLQLAAILAGARPGTPSAVPDELKPWRDRIGFFPLPAFDISATMIRARIASGLSVRYMIPPGVAVYLEEHPIYRGLYKPASVAKNRS